ncbi:hypothetical protein EJ06DRAFT_559819 [Trichodelitschia bisporula]|uniref:AAA+ ATPase domain-containing protein n=1 Tax=Trichodelitschia bisporula TaxID=703511 RepID=A0A6G1HLH0_9PEZI|nr:hypothetical protein EJ06DRAFT_559819 [Trichodelitschia bisporula]
MKIGGAPDPTPTDDTSPTSPPAPAEQHWAVMSAAALSRTSFLQMLRGSYSCVPPTARRYPLLSDPAFAAARPHWRTPESAIAYIGFDAERVKAGGGYLASRYEAWGGDRGASVAEYVGGRMGLNALVDGEVGFWPSEEEVRYILQGVGLGGLEERPVEALSNGQMRRAKIARALAMRPELVLVDGAFMGLDPASVKFVSNLLHSVAVERAPRVLFSLRPDEHIPAWVTHLIYVSRGFDILEQGPMDKVLESLSKRGEAVHGRGFHDPHTAISAQDAELYEVAQHLKGHVSKLYQVLNSYIDKNYIYFCREFKLRQRGALEKSPKSWLQSRDGYGKLFGPEVVGEPLIEMEGVKVAYGDKTVLGDWTQEVEGEQRQGLWWTIRRGERWGVFGANGSGKTTLISLLTSDHPQSYSLPIKHFGQSRLPSPGKPGIPLFALQRRIGHSSPEVHAFFPKHLSVRRVLESAWADAPLARPKLTNAIDVRVSAALRWFAPELDPNFDGAKCYDPFSTEQVAPPPDRHGKRWFTIRKELSAKLRAQALDESSMAFADDVRFGELDFSAQRVALFLRAIIAQPDVVVLDEAFSGMDDAARDKCILFLSKGEEAVHRHFRRSTMNMQAREPPARISDHVRAGLVTIRGLTDEQALIVVSHRKEEVPGAVRRWVTLPTPGAGPGEATAPRFGVLPGPLELSAVGWHEIWDFALETFSGVVPRFVVKMKADQIRAAGGEASRRIRRPRTYPRAETWHNGGLTKICGEVVFGPKMRPGRRKKLRLPGEKGEKRKRTWKAPVVFGPKQKPGRKKLPVPEEGKPRRKKGKTGDKETVDKGAGTG